LVGDDHRRVPDRGVDLGLAAQPQVDGGELVLVLAHVGVDRAPPQLVAGRGDAAGELGQLVLGRGEGSVCGREPDLGGVERRLRRRHPRVEVGDRRVQVGHLGPGCVDLVEQGRFFGRRLLDLAAEAGDLLADLLLAPLLVLGRSRPRRSRPNEEEQRSYDTSGNSSHSSNTNNTSTPRTARAGMYTTDLRR
jgi:hypothetical protein